MSSDSKDFGLSEPAEGGGDVEWEEAEDEEEDFSDLLGFDFGGGDSVDRSGLKALVNSALVTHRRLPMLDVVLDRTARRMSTSLRQLTDENVEVALDDVTSTRFGDFLQSQSQPAVLGVVRSKLLDAHCLMIADGGLIYSIVDLLLGGRRGGAALVIEDRGFTAIELSLAQRVLQLLIGDFDEAFNPVAKAEFTLDRIETTPRFAAIAQDASVCTLAKFRVSIDERNARAVLLLPHATLEPVRETLLRDFISETSGSDAVWRDHLTREIEAASVELNAVLAEKEMTIAELRALSSGDTVVFNNPAHALINLRAGGVRLGSARVGRSGGKIAVRLESNCYSPASVATASDAEIKTGDGETA